MTESMIEYGYWISTEYATFGIFSRDNKIITDAAPIAHWTIGKQVSYVLNYYRNKKNAIIHTLF